ncbi:hypothetical protein BKA66DRAFT_573786 [Pyrenochaeta sp. MPI-SDFR-AT-0127]|nr:hypothetical protein BKA66DRAFT_573786 [Pyrenochaeta sp. MPI-SDFR-AT-0127]
MRPKKNHQEHPYRMFKVPDDAPFELRPSPGKGWGAFATRNIACGSIILKEKPLFVIPKPHEMITEGDILAAFKQLPPPHKRLFLCLRNNATTEFLSMREAFAENSFMIPGRPGIRDKGHGLFLLQSRFNHSCLPNSKIPDIPDEFITRFAIRDITAGEEILFCYSPAFESRISSDRHRELRFVCNCPACLVGTPFQQLSNMRRTLIRGLQYLILGKDIDGQRQGTALSIIVDSKLKHAAENFSIPLSNRLIYNLLVMVLLEEEGLLDKFTVERRSPAMLCLPSKFKTQSNAGLAKFALTQGTWLEKFCFSLRLWGKGDAAEETIGSLFRILRELSERPIV